MAFITDYELLNNAATSGNWTASGFDSPTLNDSSSTTPIYLEGSACMWWPLKKGTTGNVYTSTITGTPSFANRVVVGLLNYPFADIDLIPITQIRIRVASNTGFSTYYEWDAIAQLLAPYNTPISGHTPIIVYAANPDGSSGTYSANIEAVGWTAVTGNDADGKQGGFDFFFVIGWVGWHSATLTNTFFSSIAAQCYDSNGGGLPGTNGRPLPIFSRAGDFYQTNVKIQLGHGTSDTANTVITETGKTIFFSNIEPEHELGYTFVDPNSTYENRLTLTDCVHFWTSQQSTHEIFTGATYATYFKLDGCSFANGGKATLPSYSTNRWVKTTKFSNCGAVTPGDGTFENNVIAGATVGVLVSGVLSTNRMKNNSYDGCTDALRIDTLQEITLDGDLFSNNTVDIDFTGSTVSTNATATVAGRAYRITTAGTTDWTAIGAADNLVGTKFKCTGVGTGTGVAARILLVEKTGGANPVTASPTADCLIYASFTHTIIGLELNTEVTYVLTGTSTEIFHVENATVSDGAGKYKTEFTHPGGQAVDILIHHVSYKPDISNINNVTLPNADASVKVTMFLDENYFNPT